MANNTIILKGRGVRNEAVASGSITPGMLVALTSAAANTVIAHNVAGGTCERAFAVEDDLQGNDIADVYASASRVQYNIMQPGDEVYALLANGESATKGVKLESNGNGYLRVVDTDTSAGDVKVQSVVGIALETVNMSDSSAADPDGRIKVRIM